MTQKAIHHFRRAIIILAEIVGVLGILVLVAWGGLVWRLSQGPLNLDLFTDYIQKSLDLAPYGFKFEAGTTVLTWGGKLEPFEIEVQNLRVSRTDGTQVLNIRKAGVLLSKRHLLLLQIVPRVVRIYNPSLRLIRWEDGHLSLNLEQKMPAVVYGPPSPFGKTASEADSVKLVQGLLTQLETGSRGGILGGLREIVISGADVTYEDKALKVLWQSRRADADFVKNREDGVTANVGLIFSADPQNQAFLRGSVHYVWATKVTEANLSFSGVNLARIAQQSEKLKDLSQVDLPLKGAVRLFLDPTFKPQKMRFTLGADAGSFNVLGFYKQPLAVSSIYVFGGMDMTSGTATIDQLKINFAEGPHLEALARMTTDPAGIRKVEAKAMVSALPMDSLPKYWPETLTPDPRAWVTGHLTKGIAEKGTLNFALSYDPAAETKAVKVEKVDGDIDFHGIRVNYFPPLEPVLDARGKATYDMKSFNLDISGGKLEDMDVTKSTIKITDLDVQSATVHSKIDIAVSLVGPLKTALKVLDSKPLEYPAMLGIKTGEVGGMATVDVGFKFPLHKALALDEVQVNADAKLKDVKLKDMVAGLDLTGGPLDLMVTSGSLKVKGNAKLGNVPAAFEWSKNFKNKSDFDSRVTAKATLDPATLAAFGVPASFAVSGAVPADVVYTQKTDKTAELKLTADIAQMGFTIPVAGYTKKTGEKGSLAVDLLLRDEKLYAMRDLSLETDQAAVRGNLDFGPAAAGGLQLKRADLKQAVLGATNVALVVEDRDGQGLNITVSGKQFDGSSMFQDNKANSDAAAAVKVTPVHVVMNVDRFVTGEGRALERAKVTLDRNAWQRLDRLEVDALAGGKPFTVRYLPQPAGHSLQVDAANAGDALRVLGLVKSIRGGKLDIDAKTPAKGNPRDLSGSVILTDFSIKDAPVFAQLLNSMSLPGILSLLSGQSGLSFKKARAGFTWTDRGQPGQAQNVRMIHLKDGKTSGASLGLTFEGSIDNWKNVYDLQGTLIPASEISKLINVIPIVGAVLTAGGEGLIGATYTIKGAKENPNVMVNPLSVLAPGILRKIFFD